MRLFFYFLFYEYFKSKTMKEENQEKKVLNNLSISPVYRKLCAPKGFQIDTL